MATKNAKKAKNPTASQKKRDRPETTQYSGTANPPSTGVFRIKTLYISCPVTDCPYTTVNAHQLKKHQATVHSIPAYRCHIQGCGKAFDDLGLYRQHHKGHDLDHSKWQCPHCSKIVATSKSLTEHLSKLHQTGRYQCANCPFFASTRNAVQLHQIDTHTVKRYRCHFPACTRVFKFDLQLARHERTHLKVKPFSCQVGDCDYKAGERYSVVKHISAMHWKDLGCGQSVDWEELIAVDEDLLARRLA